MHKSIYLHGIENKEDLSFCPMSYSKFKFGDGSIARSFGYDLANHFIAGHKDELLSHENIVLVPSPFTSIPTASSTMTQHFKEAINRFLFQHKKSALLESKIHRYRTYSEDYGSLNFEERLNLISTDTYHLDTAFLMNRMCLFIDDIKITGSHEHVIKKLIEENNLQGSFYFLYYAALQNQTIEANFENYLNYYHVKNMDDVIEITQSPNFVYNTRTIKYILISKPEEAEKFRKSATQEKLKELVNYAIGNNYHLMQEYQNNLNHFIKSVEYGY